MSTETESPAASTGRLSGAATPRARDIVFGGTVDHEIDTDMRFLVAVDRAHIAMLAMQGLITRLQARDLLDAIDRLEASDYAALRGKHAPRGLFLLYERQLAAEVGADTAGRLHTGRSRNDLKATVHTLKLREQHAALLREVLRCEAIALSAARRYADCVMAGFTHFQPAVPITYGYYLLAVAASLSREADRLLGEYRHLAKCPLGAGALAGSDLPIDPAMTADLLGFSGPTVVALDTVAGRDAALATLAIASSVALTASRVALDLQVWSAPEPGLLWYPDDLVGSSSAMPQKRNAYLLEHVRGKAGRILGAHTGFVAAAKSAPYTNSIEVGTEGIAEAWRGLSLAVEVLTLLQLHLTKGKPAPERMADHVARSWTNATAVANQLVREGHPFRLAHSAVGTVIARREAGLPDRTDDAVEVRAAALLDTVTPDEAMSGFAFGGGPAKASFALLFEQLRGDLRGQAGDADQIVRTADTWQEHLKFRCREVVGE